MSRLPGVNVVGYITGNLGLGVIAREIIGGLIARGHPVAGHDLDPGAGRLHHDLQYLGLCVPSHADLPHAITLWILGADSLEQQALKICRQRELRTRFNVIYVWWELPHVSPVRARAVHAFDALVTGSEFVQEAFRNAVGAVPVLLAETPVSLPDGVAADRRRFGLADHRFAVLTGFEPASDPARKNPWASLAAFDRAFADRQDVQLVIKLNNPGAIPRAQETVAKLEEAAARDARIRLITERLPVVDLLSLYASCDVTMSLHRSEGLGLMPLEGMRLGKPTVSTGWSGNMTYMTYANAVPVQYQLVPTSDDSLHYSPRVAGVASFWAEPDINQAAAALRWLADDPAALAALSERARAGAAAYHQRALQMRFVDELIDLQMRSAWTPSRDWRAIEQAIVSARKDMEWQNMSTGERLLARVRWRAAGVTSRLRWYR